MKKAKKSVDAAALQKILRSGSPKERLTKAEEDQAKEFIAYIEAKKKLRRELGDGDDSHWRTWIELFEASGISVDKLRSMPAADVEALFCAVIRKRRSVKPKTEDAKDWIKVAGAHCEYTAKTLGSHTKDPRHKHKIRPTDNHRGYWIHRDYLREYVQPKHLQRYETA